MKMIYHVTIVFLWMKIRNTQGYYLCVFFRKIIFMYLMCIGEIPRCQILPYLAFWKCQFILLLPTCVCIVYFIICTFFPYSETYYSKHTCQSIHIFCSIWDFGGGHAYRKSIYLCKILFTVVLWSEYRHIKYSKMVFVDCLSGNVGVRKVIHTLLTQRSRVYRKFL